MKIHLILSLFFNQTSSCTPFSVNSLKSLSIWSHNVQLCDSNLFKTDRAEKTVQTQRCTLEVNVIVVFN